MEHGMRHLTMTLVGLTLLVGCPGIQAIDDDDNGNGGIPTEIQRIFDESCGTADGTCHASGNPILALDAGSSPAILNASSGQAPLPLVELGNVTGSYLAIKVLPEPQPQRIGNLMPPPGSAYELSDEDRATLVGWIGGAPLPGGETGTQDTDDTTGDDTTGDDTEEEIVEQSCDLSDIAPDAPNPVQVGTGAEQIPPNIGSALTRNCGCHYAEGPYEGAPTLVGYPPTGPLDMITWAGFQQEQMFALCDSDVAHECVRERLDHALPMPPTSCVLEDGSRISDDDFELLDAWLAAGAPDGATWDG
jgi:hypothetical protein